MADEYREERKVGGMAQRDALRSRQIAALRAQAAAIRSRGDVMDGFFPVIHSQMGDADIAAAQKKLNGLEKSLAPKPTAAVKPTQSAPASPSPAQEAAKTAPALEKIPELKAGLPSRNKLLTQTPAQAAAELRQLAQDRPVPNDRTDVNEQPERPVEPAKPKAQTQVMESLPPPNPGAESTTGQLMGRNAVAEAAANNAVARSRVPKNINSAGRQQDAAILASPAPVATGGKANQTGNAIDYNAIRARRDIAQANMDRESANAAPFRGSTPDEIAQFYASDPNNSGSVTTTAAQLELKHAAERKALEAQHAAELAAHHAPAAGRSGSSEALMNLPTPNQPAVGVTPAPVSTPPSSAPATSTTGTLADLPMQPPITGAGGPAYMQTPSITPKPGAGSIDPLLSALDAPLPGAPMPEPAPPSVFSQGDAKWMGDGSPSPTTLAPTTGVASKNPLDAIPPVPIGPGTNPAGPNGTAYQIAPRPPTPQPSTSPVGTAVSTPSAASPAASPALATPDPAEQFKKRKKQLASFEGF